ncbi:MAG: tRNA (adenosine(37)-N6)-dimethylallyltransferase MiaA [Candidatus Competibacteraceae bacterium]|jgi:tRNA dimethylallyltransferase|nr:tRNA (adenosine(37)-N6)-dimethylallyltransferase MiaA [Candidatus Competibacteraceae bacterium]
MGPTAAGKTGLAVELVRRLPFTIISVDSALVYRGMDIGTAKPDAETQRVAPHRLIDILDPSEAYSAAQFRHDALQEIADIQAIGRIPLLVGGTMLYYRALQQGLAVLPPADVEVRARLEAERANDGLAAMHARLTQVDPVAAARIHPHDPQRIQRALEVYELTGKPITELYAHHQDKMESFRVLKWVVAPCERSVLHERIERRFQDMLTNGFVSEVETLRARGDLSLDRPAMRAVGYRQIWQYLDGTLNYTDMVAKAVTATRQMAKRQLTWLRSDATTNWIDSQSPRLLDQALSNLRAAGLPTG